MKEHKPLFDMDKPLVTFHAADGELVNWTSRNAVEGVQVFGGIGSGKTTGSGRTFALKYLAAGFGGLVLTAKTDEKDTWVDYCARTGRSQDLIVVEPGGQYHFNFLEYESKQAGGAITENLVQVLKTVINSAEVRKGGSNADPFWEISQDMLIFNVIDLCKLAYGTVSIKAMYDIVQSMPKTQDQMTRVRDRQQEPITPANAFERAYLAAAENITKQIIAWENENPEEAEVLAQTNKTMHLAAIGRKKPDVATFEFVKSFIFESFGTLPEKTRMTVEFSFSGFLFRFLREPVYSLFCANKSNFAPEDCIEGKNGEPGKIILLNLPVKEYYKAGQDIQILFKYIWQRAMEKRAVDDTSRPVFLWADESQNFLHEHDPDYQATARSKKISTVYLSQNLPNYLANMESHKTEPKVKSFLGTLNTKVFHANSDIETNRYASELIGDTYMLDRTETSTFSENVTIAHARTRKLQRVVRPEAFPLLKTGGALNDGMSEAYVQIQGLKRKSRKNYLLATFKQELDKTNNVSNAPHP